MVELEKLRIEVDRLTELTQTDRLTGLYNFHYLMTALEHELERTHRSGVPTSIIMIDLDFFKKVNDTYGHQAGNEALKHAAELWKQQVRVIDIVCRYGGEEFTLVLPGTNLSKATRTAERLRKALEQSSVEYEGQIIPLTGSFGVAVYTAKDQYTAAEFIRRADEYLLKAKAGGRNRVCGEDDDSVAPRTGITFDERNALFITRWPRMS